MTLAAVSVFLVASGIGSLCFAPGIQRVGLEMMGQPRNRLAGWCCRIVGSKTSRRSIRLTGAMCIAAGVALALVRVT